MNTTWRWLQSRVTPIQPAATTSHQGLCLKLLTFVLLRRQTGEHSQCTRPGKESLQLAQLALGVTIDAPADQGLLRGDQLIASVQPPSSSSGSIPDGTCAVNHDSSP